MKILLEELKGDPVDKKAQNEQSSLSYVIRMEIKTPKTIH
jgi:hypothetical protein